jgi:hypothetical protein
MFFTVSEQRHFKGSDLPPSGIQNMCEVFPVRRLVQIFSERMQRVRKYFKLLLIAGSLKARCWVWPRCIRIVKFCEIRSKRQVFERETQKNCQLTALCSYFVIVSLQLYVVTL